MVNTLPQGLKRRGEGGEFGFQLGDSLGRAD
jgi:hypothetical protein